MADSVRPKKAKLAEDQAEELVDVDDITDKISTNVSCVNDKIDSVLEIFDRNTCLDLLRGYHEAYYETILPENTVCNIFGCEYDYSSNTYRLMVVLTEGETTLAENFLIIKVDGSTGYPKILSVR